MPKPTRAEALDLLERHVERLRLDTPYIIALERVANWAAQFIAEDQAGRDGSMEITGLRKSLDICATIRQERDAGMDAAQEKWAALDAGKEL